MNALQKQVGGNHYKNMAIQPSEYCQKNNLNHLESNAIKYISRHRVKNGPEDIKKAIHCLELLLEIDYSDYPVTQKEAFQKTVVKVGNELPTGKSLAEFLEEEADKDNFVIGCDPASGEDSTTITDLSIDGKDIKDHVREAADILNHNRNGNLSVSGKTKKANKKLHIAVFAKTQEEFLSKIPNSAIPYNNGVEYIQESGAAFWHRIEDPINTVSWQFDGHIYDHDCGSGDPEYMAVLTHYSNPLSVQEFEGVKVFFPENVVKKLKSKLK